MKSGYCFFLALIMCSCTTTDNRSDEQAVRQVVLDFQDDFNDGAFSKADLYSTTDWDHINPAGGIDRGRELVLKSVRGVHQSFLKNVSMKIDSMQVRFVSPEVALVTTHHSVDNYITPDSVEHFNERQIKTYVIVKENNKWLLTLDHNTIVQERKP